MKKVIVLVTLLLSATAPSMAIGLPTNAYIQREATLAAPAKPVQMSTLATPAAVAATPKTTDEQDMSDEIDFSALSVTDLIVACFALIFSKLFSF